MNLYCDKCYEYIKNSNNIKAMHKVGTKFIYELDYISGGANLIKTKRNRNIYYKKFQNLVYLLEIHCNYDYHELIAEKITQLLKKLNEQRKVKDKLNEK